MSIFKDILEENRNIKNRNQKIRLDIIKNGLNEQIRYINIDKLALSENQRERVTSLHDGLETLFANYLNAVQEYLEAKNKFKGLPSDQSIKFWEQDMLALEKEKQALLLAKSKEEGEPIFIPNSQGAQSQIQFTESSKQKQLQVGIDKIDQKIRESSSRIQQLTKKLHSYQVAEETIKTQTEIFQKQCAALIDGSRHEFSQHGNCLDFFNYLVSLASAISNLFRSLHINTTAEKILDTIEYNIEVAMKKCEQIDLYDAEYYGVIKNHSFITP